MDFNAMFDAINDGISTAIDFSKEAFQDLINKREEFKKEHSMTAPVDAKGIPWSTKDLCFKLDEKSSIAYTLDYIAVDQYDEWWLMSNRLLSVIDKNDNNATAIKIKAKANECYHYHIGLDISHNHIKNSEPKTKSHDSDNTLYIKLDNGGYSYTRAHTTDAGADIRTPISFDVEPHSGVVVNTRTHVQLPKGTVGMLKSKSGLYTKHGIITTGTIDEGFTGEVIVRISNLSDELYHFNAGDKITQIVVFPVLYPEIKITDEISGGERGDDGYGSTGR